jgi:hypothetical protein
MKDNHLAAATAMTMPPSSSTTTRRTLDNVVITGYQQLDRRNLTSSVTSCEDVVTSTARD